MLIGGLIGGDDDYRLCISRDKIRVSGSYLSFA